ncbi:hypothetical protein ARMGADRAFT_1039454 [Armillaria gallica]|uniref:Uncharacterized protein n=1 Tax=Armillaria gallica TaxID=47427 RepID=A0A2H3CYY7_ARMGA|nr:hypothetical protein ARMGADRAFT_1039454 [Armillaria gallica]
MERLEREMNLTAAFPDVKNGVKQSGRGGDQNRVVTHDNQALWILAHGSLKSYIEAQKGMSVIIISITTPAHVVIVAVVSLVIVVVVAMCTFDSPSHTEMMADVEFPHVAYTLVGYWVDWDGDGGQICGHGSSQCLRRGWEQDMCNPELLGPPDAWKEANKKLEVI